MHGLETTQTLNTEVTIKAILARAAANGITLTRDEVLEELKFREDDDTTVWGATVDRLIRESAS
jgi:hypothetical protein